MKRKTFLQILSSGMAYGSMGFPLDAEEEMTMMSEKPNIIFLIPHDIGRSLGCYGYPFKTPNLDAFAAEGALFRNAFCSSPCCSPSRACAYTGLYPHQNGMMGLSHKGWAMKPGVPTVVDYLKQAGYETAHAGASHERSAGETEHRYDVELNQTFEDGFINHAVDRAIDYLKNQRPADKPFYLNIGSLETHATTWMEPGINKFSRAGHYGKTPPEDVWLDPFFPDHPLVRDQRGNFQACVRFFDHHVGRLLKAIKELDLEKHTLVVMTTDHGVSGPQGKGNLYDKGVEVMLMMRLPGTIPAGQDITALVPNIDLAANLLDVAGLEHPPDMEGRTLWPLVTGKDYAEHDALFIQRNYHAGRNEPMRAVRTQRFHYIRYWTDLTRDWRPYEIEHRLFEEPDDSMYRVMPEPEKSRPREELFYLPLDPYEAHNLAGDPGIEHIRKDLSERLDAFMRETNDPLLEGKLPEPPYANTASH